VRGRPPTCDDEDDEDHKKRERATAGHKHTHTHMSSAAEASFDYLVTSSAGGENETNSGRMFGALDYMKQESGGSLKLSGRDLLDILNQFTADPSIPPLDPPPVPDGETFQEKDNTQPMNTIQPQANMFQASAEMRRLGGSSKRFQDLGRCPPVGGAYPQFFAPGYDDFGYSSPSPMDPSSGMNPQASIDPQAAIHNPMTFDNIVLAGKNIPGLGAGVAAASSQPPVVQQQQQKKKGRHAPLKTTQARTGYQHKPRKPHPVVEKARRDGINALIEDLRDVVPEGGWKPTTSCAQAGAGAGGYRKTTSLRDALESIHQGQGGAMAPKPDKRTKRAVLMDSIASIEKLRDHVKMLEQQVAVVAKAGADAAGKQAVAMEEGEGLTAAGASFDEKRMMAVHAEVSLRDPAGQPASVAAKVGVEAVAATPLLVSVAYFDRRGFLADQCVAMRSLGMTIKSAELPKPNRNGMVKDTFEVSVEEPAEEVNTAHLQAQLVEALEEVQSIYYGSQQQQNPGEKRART